MLSLWRADCCLEGLQYESPLGIKDAGKYKNLTDAELERISEPLLEKLQSL